MLRLNASPLSEPAPRALHRVRRHALQAALDRVEELGRALEELLALLEELGRALARDALQLRRARHEQLGAAQLARARLGQQRELEQLWRLLGLVPGGAPVGRRRL